MTIKKKPVSYSPKTDLFTKKFPYLPCTRPYSAASSQPFFTSIIIGMDEIAEIMGVSVRTVERYRNKALDILKKELKDYLPFLLFLNCIP